MTNLLFLIGISLLPVYLWESGGLQLSHAVLACAAGLFLVRRGIHIIDAEVVIALLLLVVAGREAAAVIAGQSPSAMLSLLYVAFSLVIFNVVRRWIALGNERWLLRALFLAMVIAIVGVLVNGYGTTVAADGTRSVGTFNNPNQLGYFAVCSFSLGGLLYLRGYLKPKPLVSLVAAAIFLSIASLSKAAMVGVAFGILFIGFAAGGPRKRLLIGTGFALAAVTATIAALRAGYLDGFQFVMRLKDIGKDADDSLAGRGYAAFEQMNGRELLFGLGSEGAEALLGHEVHSTIVSFFVSYGFFGGVLFLAFHFVWLRRLFRRLGVPSLFIVAAPALLFGITHNGSRFTIYWVLLAASFALIGRQKSNIVRPYYQRAQTPGQTVHGSYS